MAAGDGGVPPAGDAPGAGFGDNHRGQAGDAMNTAAIILAGGRGARANTAGPKQFADLAGVPVLVRTVLAFLRVPEVDGLVVVAPPDGVDRTRILLDEHAVPNGIDVVPGGGTRQSSALAGIERVAFRGDHDTVLIHDAVRPLVDPAVIAAVIRAIPATGAAVAGSPVTDTLLVVRDGAAVDATPREGLYHARTPQGFRLSLIRDAHRRALAEGRIDASDDVQLVLRLGVAATVVPCGPENLKITLASDLRLAHALLATRE
jgi:2-C-methyl-D-erythritol 4-phosphate cytidylyltransferase